MFKDMYNITPAYQKAYIVRNLMEHKWDISGIVGIVGDTEGVFVFRLKRTTAFKLLNITTPTRDIPADEIIDLISDMVSEYANIICGNALNLLPLGNSEVTVPFTVQGTNHTISWPIKGKIISIPFNTPYGIFEIQISLSAYA